jgi:hypothetical protein
MALWFSLLLRSLIFGQVSNLTLLNLKSASMRLALSALLTTLLNPNLMARDVILRPQQKLNERHSAIDAIREERARTGDVSPVRIIVENGTFQFDTPLILRPAESNIAIEAKADAHPTFWGGKTISRWDVDDRGVWTTRIDPEWRFETLLGNGKRGVRARTPNRSFFQGIAQPKTPVENVPLTGDPNKTLVAIKPDNAASLSLLTPEEQSEFRALVYHSWAARITSDKEVVCYLFQNGRILQAYKNPPGPFGQKAGLQRAEPASSRPPTTTEIKAPRTPTENIELKFE